MGISGPGLHVTKEADWAKCAERAAGKRECVCVCVCVCVQPEKKKKKKKKKK